jgi:hypothetical protein
VCKIAEHIITSQIHDHLEEFKLLTDSQHGFRRRRSCESQLLLTTKDFFQNLDKKSQTDVILLDFAKAFDRVPHDLLIHKLHHYGIDPDVMKLINAFLSDRTQEVIVEGKMSGATAVTSGVPQGSVLGPLMFLLYINEMPEYISNQSCVRLFADDAVIYREVNTESEAVCLQEDLNRLLQWEADWGMSFHPSKCQVIRVTNKKKEIESCYNIRGHALEIVTPSKYFGVTISKSLK